MQLTHIIYFCTPGILMCCLQGPGERLEQGSPFGWGHLGNLGSALFFALRLRFGLHYTAQMKNAPEVQVEAAAACDVADNVLLDRFRNEGDQAAFSELTTRYRGLVYSICCRCLWNFPAEVDDAVQATFVILSRKCDGIAERQSIGPWLHHTGTRVCANMVRKGTARLRREKRYDEMRESATRIECEQPSDDHTASVALHAAIAELPDSQREVIVHHYWQGRSFEHIAEAAGTSPESIRMKAMRARKKLKQKLEKRGVVLSVAALVTLLETEAEAVQESGVRSQVSVGEASETAKSLADSVLREMGRQRVLKVAGIVAAGLVLAGCIGAAVSFSGPSFRSLRSFGSLEPATQWRVASVSGAVEGCEVGKLLCPGDTIRTGPGQEVELLSGDGDRLLLREEGELQHPTSNAQRPSRESPGFACKRERWWRN